MDYIEKKIVTTIQMWGVAHLIHSNCVHLLLKLQRNCFQFIHSIWTCLCVSEECPFYTKKSWYFGLKANSQFAFVGDQLLSGSFPYKELYNGVLWEVEGKVSFILSFLKCFLATCLVGMHFIIWTLFRFKDEDHTTLIEFTDQPGKLN